MLVMGVPCQCFRNVLADCSAYVRPWVRIIRLSIGLENGTSLRMTEIIDELLPGHPAGVLAGPNLSREIISGRAAASVIAIPMQLSAYCRLVFVRRFCYIILAITLFSQYTYCVFLFLCLVLHIGRLDGRQYKDFTIQGEGV